MTECPVCGHRFDSPNAAAMLGEHLAEEHPDHELAEPPTAEQLAGTSKAVPPITD